MLACLLPAQMRAQGTYINDKIDLLVQYLLIDPFQALYSRITKREVHATPPRTPLSLPATAANGSAPSSLHADTAPTCSHVSS